MKNLTLRIDEKVLAEARKLAALRGTTVARLVRDYLAALVEAGEAGAAAEIRRRLAGREGSRSEIYEESLKRLHGRRADAPGFAETAPHEDAALPEAAAARRPTLEELTTDTGAPPEPGHDEWFRRQVQKTLEKKQAGAVDYHDLRDVAAEFGLNAR